MMKATDARQSDHLCAWRRTSLNAAPLRCISNYIVNTLRIVVGDSGVLSRGSIDARMNGTTRVGSQGTPVTRS